MQMTDFYEPKEEVKTSAYAQFFEKLRACPVGKAFTVSGVDRNVLSARVTQFHKRNDGIRFKTNKIGDAEFQVRRIL